MTDYRAFQLNAFENSSSVHKYNAFQTLNLGLATSQGSQAASMQLLGIGSTSNLYWDYSNTEDFYLLSTDGKNITLTPISPVAANNWFQTQVQTTIYNPFSYNNSRPLSGL